MPRDFIVQKRARSYDHAQERKMRRQRSSGYVRVLVFGFMAASCGLTGCDNLPADHYSADVQYSVVKDLTLSGESEDPSEIYSHFEWQEVKARGLRTFQCGRQTFLVKYAHSHAWERISLEDMITEADHEGYLPATLHEFVAFALTRPHVRVPQQYQRLSVVALGSFVKNKRGDPSFPRMVRDGGRTSYRFTGDPNHCDVNVAFLFVKKPEQDKPDGGL